LDFPTIAGGRLLILSSQRSDRRERPSNWGNIVAKWSGGDGTKYQIVGWDWCDPLTTMLTSLIDLLPEGSDPRSVQCTDKMIAGQIGTLELEASLNFQSQQPSTLITSP
jgi:hypothetical protein